MKKEVIHTKHQLSFPWGQWLCQILLSDEATWNKLEINLHLFQNFHHLLSLMTRFHESISMYMTVGIFWQNLICLIQRVSSCFLYNQGNIVALTHRQVKQHQQFYYQKCLFLLHHKHCCQDRKCSYLFSRTIQTVLMFREQTAMMVDFLKRRSLLLDQLYLHLFPFE